MASSGLSEGLSTYSHDVSIESASGLNQGRGTDTPRARLQKHHVRRWLQTRIHLSSTGRMVLPEKKTWSGHPLWTARMSLLLRALFCRALAWGRPEPMSGLSKSHAKALDSLRAKPGATRVVSGWDGRDAVMGTHFLVIHSLWVTDGLRADYKGGSSTSQSALYYTFSSQNGVSRQMRTACFHACRPRM